MPNSQMDGSFTHISYTTSYPNAEKDIGIGGYTAQD